MGRVPCRCGLLGGWEWEEGLLGGVWRIESRSGEREVDIELTERGLGGYLGNTSILDGRNGSLSTVYVYMSYSQYNPTSPFLSTPINRHPSSRHLPARGDRETAQSGQPREAWRSETDSERI